MVRCTNSLFGLINLAAFLLSIPILGGGIWLATKADTDCDEVLEWPVICIGALLMLVSLAGLVGVCCKVRWLLWLYLCAMSVLILLLLCSTIFSFVVTINGSDHSGWLHKRVDKESKWRKIKSCIQDGKECKSLDEDSVNEAAEQFYQKKLSRIQSGCCKPPASCGFTYRNATYWVPSATKANSSDSDCARWSNDQRRLCYDCSSCKAGVLANLKRDWRRDAIINVATLAALVVVYSLGCCAFRNIRRGKLEKEERGTRTATNNNPGVPRGSQIP